MWPFGRCSPKRRPAARRSAQAHGLHAVRRRSESRAKTYLIPARADIRAQRPTPGEFNMLAPDWDYVKKNQTQLVSRFSKEIVEQIVQKR